MIKEVSAFLSEGRRFRSVHTTGPVLMVGMNPYIREVAERWVAQVGAPILSCDSLTEAEAFLPQNPKWVMFGIDGFFLDRVVEFLKHLEKDYSSAIVVVLSSYSEIVRLLSIAFPRVTFVVKGEGLAETFRDIFAERAYA